MDKATHKKRKWYSSYKLPLIPVFTTRKGDEHSTNGFTFEWLVFKLWSLDACSFELGITCSGHWGLGVIAILPYLRVVVCIPCPERLGTVLNELTGRNQKK